MSDNRALVVLDTNVFVAAYWAPNSASARLIQACIDGRIRAAYTNEVKREVVAILSKIRMPESYMFYVDSFWEAALQVEPLGADDISIDDPDDRKFLEAAAGAEADFLATNDDHLLSVGYVGRTEILTPGSLARLLGL